MMNLDKLVTRGQLPWSPVPAARDLNIWIEYDHPLAGTFATDNQAVLFAVVGDSSARRSVWAYAILTPAEAGQYADLAFDSVTELRQFVEDRISERQAVFALADDLVIQIWAPADSAGPLYEKAIAFLDSILDRPENHPDPGTRFRAKLAQVDVVRDELVGA